METFDLNFEKQLIKDEAEEIYENIIDLSERRHIEKDFVFTETIKALQSFAREDGII